MIKLSNTPNQISAIKSCHPPTTGRVNSHTKSPYLSITSSSPHLKKKNSTTTRRRSKKSCSSALHLFSRKVTIGIHSFSIYFLNGTIIIEQPPLEMKTHDQKMRRDKYRCFDNFLHDLCNMYLCLILLALSYNT